MSSSRKQVTREEQAEEVQLKLKNYAEDGFTEAPRMHELILQANPDLQPRLWYGMPGYAKSKDSAVLVFFRKDSLISFGITEAAKPSHAKSSDIYPSAWYITALSDDVEQHITQTVLKYTS